MQWRNKENITACKLRHDLKIQDRWE